MGISGTVDGLHYELHGGPVAGREVLLLSSGLGGSGAFWAPQMDALTAHYPVVLYDHRGTGRSVRDLPSPSNGPYAVQDMADDMVKVMDALGLDRAHVVGHAAGGNAGLALALSHPDRLGKLVVVNGWSRPDPHIRRCFDTRLHLLNDSGVEAYVHA
ncbi:MAG: alpha/beta fold hydrolase, partial [Alphaproteobacteria bacterium]|nr:alpha/beta fold hydrolase [Alphaproteobacteria bacterium]